MRALFILIIQFCRAKIKVWTEFCRLVVVEIVGSKPAQDTTFLSMPELASANYPSNRLVFILFAGRFHLGILFNTMLGVMNLAP